MDYLFVSGASCRRFPETIAVYREEHGGDITLGEGDFSGKPLKEHVEDVKV